MRYIKFKRYIVGEVFNPSIAERDTIHIVPVSTDPLTVKMYDVDSFGNVADVKNDDWEENKELILNALEGFSDTLTESLVPAEVNKLGLVKKAPIQQNSTATTVGEMVSDFNALLDKMRSSGVISV